MNIQNREKHKILESIPSGAIFTQSWLSSKGISNQLSQIYLKNQSIKRVVRGVYAHYKSEVSLEGIVYGLYYSQQLPIHISGISALEIEGGSHYLSKQKKMFISRHSEEWIELPKWYYELKKEGYSLFLDNRKLFDTNPGYIKTIGDEETPVYYSMRERALIEMLQLVPNKVSFDNAYHLMESLIMLRPKVLNDILSQVKSKKVLRIFWYLANRLEMPWVEKLDYDFSQMIKGILVLQKGGEYDSKHKIYVPRI